MRGEIKVYNYAQNPDLYEIVPVIYIGDDPHETEKARHQGNTVILTVSGVHDRNAAEALRDQFVYIDEKDLPEPEEGTYYVKDIVGFDVVTEDGETVGTLEDVSTERVQDLYCVKIPAGKIIYIPGVKEFIKKIDVNEKKIIVYIPDGLMDL